jgi:hypothetical protein
MEIPIRRAKADKKIWKIGKTWWDGPLLMGIAKKLSGKL